MENFSADIESDMDTSFEMDDSISDVDFQSESADLDMDDLFDEAESIEDDLSIDDSDYEKLVDDEDFSVDDIDDSEFDADEALSDADFEESDDVLEETDDYEMLEEDNDSDDITETEEDVYEELEEENDSDDITETETDDEGEDAAEYIKQVVDQNVTEAILPKNNGHWADETKEGEGLWIPDDDAEFSWRKNGEQHTMTYRELKDRYGIDGIEYNNKEPDFSPFEDDVLGHVELEHMSGNRQGADGTFTAAEAKTAESLGWTTQEVRDYMRENGLTWHECADRKTVRAIPTEINAGFRHTGGISVERSVEAMANEINDQYGTVALARDGISGAVNADALDDAVEDAQSAYRARKRNL